MVHCSCFVKIFGRTFLVKCKDSWVFEFPYSFYCLQTPSSCPDWNVALCCRLIFQLLLPILAESPELFLSFSKFPVFLLPQVFLPCLNLSVWKLLEFFLDALTDLEDSHTFGLQFVEMISSYNCLIWLVYTQTWICLFLSFCRVMVNTCICSDPVRVSLSSAACVCIGNKNDSAIIHGSVSLQQQNLHSAKTQWRSCWTKVTHKHKLIFLFTSVA